MTYYAPHKKHPQWLSDAARLLEAPSWKQIVTYFHTADFEEATNKQIKFWSRNHFERSYVNYHHHNDKMGSVPSISPCDFSTPTWPQFWFSCTPYHVFLVRLLIYYCVVINPHAFFESLGCWRIHHWDCLVRNYMCCWLSYIIAFCISISS